MEQPNVARMYDYYLGGTENRAADRAAADQVLAGAPQVRVAVAENRGFLERAVRFLAGQGVRAYLDLGSGLPTRRNVHEILAEVAPDSRVTYVDYDPAVVERGAELVAGAPGVAVVLGDVRRLDDLFAQPAVRDVVAGPAPVAVLLVAVLNFVADADDPRGIVADLGRRTPPGSWFAVSHGARPDDAPRADDAPRTDDAPRADDVVAGIERAYRRTSGAAVMRSRAELAAILAGSELVGPGITYGAQWSSERAGDDPGTAMTLAAVGRFAPR